MLEPPALVAGLDDVAVMGEPIEQRGGHFGIAEHGRPFAERQVGGDDDRGVFVKSADEMEQQLPASAGERQIDRFVEEQERWEGRSGGGEGRSQVKPWWAA